MTILKRKSAAWYFISLGVLIATWISLQFSKRSFDEASVESLFGNYIIPLSMFVLVTISVIIKEHDEPMSLMLILFATYVHLSPGFEKVTLITYLIHILFPVIFTIRVIQFIKRKGIKRVTTYVLPLVLIFVYLYLFFYFPIMT